MLIIMVFTQDNKAAGRISRAQIATDKHHATTKNVQELHKSFESGYLYLDLKFSKLKYIQFPKVNHKP